MAKHINIYQSGGRGGGDAGGAEGEKGKIKSSRLEEKYETLNSKEAICYVSFAFLDESLPGAKKCGCGGNTSGDWQHFDKHKGEKKISVHI